MIRIGNVMKSLVSSNYTSLVSEKCLLATDDKTHGHDTRNIIVVVGSVGGVLLTVAVVAVVSARCQKVRSSGSSSLKCNWLRNNNNYYIFCLSLDLFLIIFYVLISFFFCFHLFFFFSSPLVLKSCLLVVFRESVLIVINAKFVKLTH